MYDTPRAVCCATHICQHPSGYRGPPDVFYDLHSAFLSLRLLRLRVCYPPLIATPGWSLALPLYLACAVGAPASTAYYPASIFPTVNLCHLSALLVLPPTPPPTSPSLYHFHRLCAKYHSLRHSLFYHARRLLNNVWAPLARLRVNRVARRHRPITIVTVVPRPLGPRDFHFRASNTQRARKSVETQVSFVPIVKRPSWPRHPSKRWARGHWRANATAARFNHCFRFHRHFLCPLGLYRCHALILATTPF